MNREDLRRHQLFQFAELLIDLIHGDLIRGDTACSRVAGAFIAAYEETIRSLVTQETTFTPPLKGAVNIYCARHALRTAPELLIASDAAASAYKQIAGVLCGAEGMSDIGRAMEGELSHLTRRLEKRRFLRLLDLMGDAVVVYMKRAFQLHEEKAASSVSLQEHPVFWGCVKRFIDTPARVRERSQSRSPGRQCEGKEKEDVVVDDNNPIQGPSPVRDFSEEFRRAMCSPDTNRNKIDVNSHFTSCARPQPSPPVSTETEDSVRRNDNSVPSMGRRALLHPNNSLLTAMEEMERRDSQNTHDVSSGIIVADDSDTSLMPIPATVRKGVILAGDLHEDDNVPLLGHGVHARSYFLSATTNRYEPEAARGFFT